MRGSGCERDFVVEAFISKPSATHPSSWSPRRPDGFASGLRQPSRRRDRHADPLALRPTVSRGLPFSGHRASPLARPHVDKQSNPRAMQTAATTRGTYLLTLLRFTSTQGLFTIFTVTGIASCQPSKWCQILRDPPHPTIPIPPPCETTTYLTVTIVN